MNAYIIFMIIDIVLCILCKRNIYSGEYNEEDQRPLLSWGTFLLLLATSFVYILNIIVCSIAVIALSIAALEGELNYRFKSEFFEQLFTR